RLGLLRDKLIDGVLKTIPDSVLNGSRNQRISCNANFSFRGISGDALLAALNLRGIYASAGSACSAGLSAPSHVLLAMGLPAELAGGSLRMTLGRLTSAEDIDYVLEVLPEVVSRLREIVT
ncbi:MAG: aminotransferase class V-fold PLP-dependent enzyme, partial [Clostridia bacterium]|nr:aminotransferase class V-fold PLP-dependent enzyme [Clostridia bacterium]